MKTQYKNLATLKKLIKGFILLLLCCLFSFCKKDRLEIKPDDTLVIPATLRDFQALLDNAGIMNNNYPPLGEAGGDNYYLLPARWNSFALNNRDAYVWAKQLREWSAVGDWNFAYARVFYANIVLKGLTEHFPKENTSEANIIRGTALFHRGNAFFQLAEVFCKVYDSSTADSDLGIPLKLDPDVRLMLPRASLSETYRQILADIQEAVNLLPNNSMVKTRPTKATAHALLSRIYLSMADYAQAFNHSDASIKANGKLLDYNQLNATNALPIPLYNDEVLLHARIQSTSFFVTGNCPIDTLLYRSYHTNDLRKSLFFRTETNGAITFRGSYASGFHFGGISNDEVYLTRAECYARKSMTQEAIGDLNQLMEKRWRAGTFVPFNAATPEQALDIILEERRKELLLRGRRWTDLKRLNKYPRYAKTLTRKLGNEIYSLSPGDPRYIYPIPDSELLLNSLEQNIR